AVLHIASPFSYHDEAMKLLTFSKFVACISRGSFKMPGRTKVTSMIDELYEEMMMKLKDMLKQSSSVSLTTDAAKMPTGDSYVAITGHWISSEWELLSAVLAVSVSNVSHTAEEIATLVQQLGIKYTLDDRLDAISTDNGANFVAAMKELLEDGICEEHVRCACHTLQLTIKNHIDPPKPINGSAATNATSELVGIHTLKLIKDVVTRWNSTFYMLARCVLLEVPLRKMIDELGLDGPTDDDWSAAQLLCHFMKPFQVVTDFLQDVVLEQAKTTTIMGLGQDLGSASQSSVMYARLCPG
ncbi:hypothetical protein EMCRGX_G004453, partial [Ephydatia muelleri]